MHSEANRRITCCAKAAVATVLPKKDVLADALKNNKKMLKLPIARSQMWCLSS